MIKQRDRRECRAVRQGFRSTLNHRSKLWLVLAACPLFSQTRGRPTLKTPHIYKFVRSARMSWGDSLWKGFMACWGKAHCHITDQCSWWAMKHLRGVLDNKLWSSAADPSLQDWVSCMPQLVSSQDQLKIWASEASGHEMLSPCSQEVTT